MAQASAFAWPRETQTTNQRNGLPEKIEFHPRRPNQHTDAKPLAHPADAAVNVRTDYDIGTGPHMESVQRNNATPAAAPGGEEVDFSLLQDTLRLTPWERFLENERALDLIRMLEAAQPTVHGSPGPDS
jgi:hypothetical protein